jgi:hypothetical protein
MEPAEEGPIYYEDGGSMAPSCQTTWRHIPQDNNLAFQMVLMKNEEAEFYTLIKY